MRGDVDKVGVWKDDEGRWRWTAFIGDQPLTSSEGFKTKAEAAEDGDVHWPKLKPADHKGDDPRTFKFKGEKGAA